LTLGTLDVKLALPQPFRIAHRKSLARASCTRLGATAGLDQAMNERISAAELQSPYAF